MNINTWPRQFEGPWPTLNLGFQYNFPENRFL